MLMLKKKRYKKEFEVVFVKRSTNRRRKMKCQFGVERDLNGKGLPFKPINANLCVVFDTVKQEYRMVDLSSLLRVTCNGKTYKKKVKSK